MARYRGANRRRFVLALVVLTSLTLITLDSRSGRSGPLGVVGRLAHTILSPIERATSAVAHPVGDWWSGVVDSGSLKRQNRSLRERIAKLEGEQRAAQIARHEDALLKQLVGLQFLQPARPITARVVDRDPGNFESTLTIDRGQEAGIDKGMAVVSFEGVVGHVVDAWRGGAKIIELNDPESAIAVRTIDHPSVGIAQGHAGSTDLVVADFDERTKIKVGDAVISADVSTSVYPPDLQVGTVSSVDKQPAGLGVIVHIRPYVDFGALEFVDVLRWVPGEGPVVTTTTTTTTTPGGSTSTSTSTTTTTTTSSSGTGG